VQELSKISDETVIPPTDVPSTGKSLPPMLISDSLPPVPASLVKKIQEGRFIEMAELLISPDYIADENSKAHKQKPKKSPA